MFSTARRTVAQQALSAAPLPKPFSASAPRRLLSSLTIIEQRDGKLNAGSLNAISAAQKLGGPVHCFVAGGSVKSVAEELSKVSGVEKVIVVESDAYEKGFAENYAPLVVENVKKGAYTQVVAGHTTFGKNLMPRVAALLDSQQVSDIIGIENESTFERPIYAGNLIAQVQSLDPIKVVTVRGTAFPAAATEGGSAAVEDGVDPKAAGEMKWLEENLAKSDRPDLASASRVVSGGRGLKSAEDFTGIMTPLADSLGAAIGASRAACDSGMADNSLQVGQTGKVVAPQLYMAIGISGAIQHLAGMKDSKVIAAINKDPDAPIFEVADVGLVGDLFKEVPELVKKLKE